MLVCHGSKDVWPSHVIDDDFNHRLVESSEYGEDNLVVRMTISSSNICLYIHHLPPPRQLRLS